ncbi:MAG TPA: hypothetical protein VFV63_11690 [Ilumatobacteraceae bacterium]|nr:hypothetical protein [Ilumatobacteraceae bacterium]
MSRRAKTADDDDRPKSGPLGPWRLALVMLAVVSTSGAVLAQSVQTGDGLDLALGRALGVAIVLWILLGSIDRMLARAQHARHDDENHHVTGGDPTAGDTITNHR